MPVTLKKLPRKPLYRVSTPGGVKARATTKKKAEAQARLLRAIDHGWKPTRRLKESTTLVDQLLESPYCYSCDRESTLLWYTSDGKIILHVIGWVTTYHYAVKDKEEAAAVMRQLGIAPATEHGIQSGTLPISAVEQLKGLPIYTKIKADLDAHFGVDTSKDAHIQRVTVDNVEFDDFIREFSDYVMVRSDYSTVHVPAYRKLGFAVITVTGNKFIHELLLLVPETEFDRALRRLARLQVSGNLAKHESASALVHGLLESPYYYYDRDEDTYDAGEWALHDFTSPRVIIKVGGWKIGGRYETKDPDAIMAFKRLTGVQQDRWSGYSSGAITRDRKHYGVWFDDLLELPVIGPQLAHDAELNKSLGKDGGRVVLKTRLPLSVLGRHFKDVTFTSPTYAFSSRESRAALASKGFTIVELSHPDDSDYCCALVPSDSVEKFTRQVAALELANPPATEED